MKNFKSVRRAFKRGHLVMNRTESQIPVFVLLRKTRKGFAPYSNFGSLHPSNFYRVASFLSASK